MKSKCLFKLEKLEEGIESLEKTLNYNNKDVSAMILLSEKLILTKNYELSFYCLLKSKKNFCFNEEKKTTLWSFSKSDLPSRFWNCYFVVKEELSKKTSPLFIDSKLIERYKENSFFFPSLSLIDDLFRKDLNSSSFVIEDENENNSNLIERDPRTL